MSFDIPMGKSEEITPQYLEENVRYKIWREFTGIANMRNVMCFCRDIHSANDIISALQAQYKPTVHLYAELCADFDETYDAPFPHEKCVVINQGEDYWKALADRKKE